jgi:murein DD-endopeptidase MepM/ murein hydrolase activator NlpD
MSKLANHQINKLKMGLAAQGYERRGTASPGFLLLLCLLLTALLLLLTGCKAQNAAAVAQDTSIQSQVGDQPGLEATPSTFDNPQSSIPTATPFPTRPPYEPGELVDYVAQSGDTLPALARRFNTTVDEILAANPFIPTDATTMPPGMPMQIPIYYLTFWGSQYHILPDSMFINGPDQTNFDTIAFVEASPGWLKDYNSFAAGKNLKGGEIIEMIAAYYSINPRVLLTLLEYQIGALSQPQLPPYVDPDYPLGYEVLTHRGLYMQLVWTANILNNGYYGWRIGQLLEFDLPDGSFERYDPWQNAATVALGHYFLQNENDLQAYRRHTGPDGFAFTYQKLFGDPWTEARPHMEGSLQQPEMVLPFEAGKTWAYTGGPHTGWGSGLPFAAIDFAPPSESSGCVQSREWVTAVADGVITHHDTGVLELDLDGDGDPRTGWVVLYLHIATRDKAPVGTVVQTGDILGHPSCEGGTSTGTHIHIARKYNGEWIAAEGRLAFNLEGWIAENGQKPYEGYLRRFSQVVTACTCSNSASQLTSALIIE